VRDGPARDRRTTDVDHDRGESLLAIIGASDREHRAELSTGDRTIEDAEALRRTRIEDGERSAGDGQRDRKPAHVDLVRTEALAVPSEARDVSRRGQLVTRRLDLGRWRWRWERE
jgi:hypothetical protein